MSASILLQMAEIQVLWDGLDMEEACWLLVEDMMLKELLNMALALKLHSTESHHRQESSNKNA